MYFKRCYNSGLESSVFYYRLLIYNHYTGSNPVLSTMDSLFLYEILVPTQTNDGKPLRTRFHRVWDSKVRAITGGLTIIPPVKGQWVSSEGQLFAERMIPVRIACTPEQIDKISDMTAKYYTQKAILFYLISTKVTIKNYD